MEVRQIPQFPEHSISECGQFILNKHGRNIKQSGQYRNGKPTGYIYATMFASDYTYRKRVAVHRLVAYTWLADPLPGQVWVNHKDGNKANNHASNLEWTTIAQNIQHSFDVLGRKTYKGEDHWLYGRKVSIETKAKMSAKKLGCLHPKFKGWYVANFKRFESSIQAGRYLNMNSRTIYERCHNPKFKAKGYYFIPLAAQATAE